jgi:thioredoxin
MPVANSDDEGQTEWIKQTTIMTSKPMVIDFFATWCGPCKELAPVLDKIEQNHKGEVIFKRVDVDQEPELAMEFRVEAVPTLMFVTPKGEYQTLLGYQEAPVIEAKIAELLKRSTK